jgi:hypothetical protein
MANTYDDDDDDDDGDDELQLSLSLLRLMTLGQAKTDEPPC